MSKIRKLDPSLRPKIAMAALVQANNTSVKHYIFDKENILGRSENAFIVVKHPEISRQHCVIEVTDDQMFTIRDMSIHGTYVNDEKLEKDVIQELNHLDVIRLANYPDCSYTLVINRKFREPEKYKKRNSHLNDMLVDLNETQTFEKECIHDQLTKMKKETNRLKGEMQERLEAKEKEFKDEKTKMFNLLSSTREQKEESENKLKKLKERSRLEKERLVQEVESKLADITKQEVKLQKIRDEMEARHRLERCELENKCKAEIEELKQKLVASEVEQGRLQELESQLDETKKILLESEMEQYRLFDEKLKTEAKLESKIIDLTNESECKTEEVKELEKKLKEQEAFQETVKKEIEGLEDDMQCSVCTEVYIEPTALNCGHMFCKSCIDEWKKKKKVCPMCRAKLVTSVRIFNMDSVIERNIRLMSEEARTRHELLIAERKKGPAKRSSKKRKHKSTNTTETTSTPHRSPVALMTVEIGHYHRPRITEYMYPLRVTEHEGDVFQDGWVVNMTGRRRTHNSTVTAASVDLTNMSTPVMARADSTSTVTSADMNTTIDLTSV